MTIPISEIRDNDILNEEVKEKNGSIILPRGTILKREYIDLLDELKVKTVSVDKPGGIVKEDIGQTIVERIRKLYETHIYQNRARLAEFTKIAEDAIVNFKQRRLLEDVSGDEDMYEEIYLTAAMSYEMAENRGFSDKQLFDMVLGVMLMEIGTRYLVFPIGRRLNLAMLSREEMNEYLKHPIIGYTILEKEDWISEQARKIILFHHEREDGSGFPMRKKTEDPMQIIVQQAVIQVNSMCGR